MSLKSFLGKILDEAENLFGFHQPPEGTPIMSDFTVIVGQSLTLAVKPKNQLEAPYSGAPVPAAFTLDTPDFASLVPAEDGLSVSVTGVAAGVATLTVVEGEKSKAFTVDVAAEVLSDFDLVAA